MTRRDTTLAASGAAITAGVFVLLGGAPPGTVESFVNSKWHRIGPGSVIFQVSNATFSSARTPRFLSNLEQSASATGRPPSTALSSIPVIQD